MDTLRSKMEEASVGASIELLVENLLSMLREQISLFRNHKPELEKLKKSFSMVKAFLNDAEKKQLVTNEAVRIWLRNLEALAYEAYNVFDDIDYELLSEKVGATKNKSLKRKFQSFSSNLLGSRIKDINLGSRIKDINEKLKYINKQAKDFGLQIIVAHASVSRPDAYAGVETDSFSADPDFLGRENDVSTIVKMLITTPGPDKQALSVLPIVGMGGLGKTTLARKVFGNEQIISHFGDNRVWVYVSRNFDVRNILKNILTSLTRKRVKLETMEALLKELQKHLEAKKYLLVLDDVWIEDRGKWDDFVNSLLGISSANGFCMIVTTRSKEVASIVKTLDVHNLKGLPENDCLSIIKAKAFRGGNALFDFDAILKNIARKCQGLPLAAKVVGGLLSSRKSKDEWMSIEKNWLLDLRDESHISDVLKLSFDHLMSPSLKKCFAYCSIFPKGYEIEKERLVELWMAEGFLHKINMETTGNRNFKILLKNSLLQCARSDDYGNVTHCSMHDLVHDVAYIILCEKDDVTEGVCKSRYIGYKPGGDGLSSIPKGQEGSVRTLFFDGKVSDIKFSDFESLHTLTLVGKDIDDMPISIKDLKHLRYLDVSETRIKCLPDWIGELYHLQTLRSPMIEEEIKLPDSLSCLISLRHLYISDGTTLPPEIGKLTSLQTLPYFDVRCEKGCGISELGHLKNLKGELEIHNLESVRNKNEAMSAYLIRKTSIYKLKLVWYVGNEENDGSVLEGLQPHPDLMKLGIYGFEGKIFPPWTSKMAVQQLDGRWEGLNNLMEIKLEYCSECEELPMLGQLRNLKFLYLRGLRNVKSIGHSFYGLDNCEHTISNNGSICVVVFRALERLEMWGMPNLKEWGETSNDQPSDEVVVFPCLKYLKIQGCCELMSAPSHFPCLRELIIEGMESSLPLETICGMKLTTLTHLTIDGIKGVKCLPDRLFSNNHNLSKLEIRDCPKLTHLVPMILRGGGAPSLRELSISGCRSLSGLPDDLHSINSLETLHIYGSPDLKSIPYPSSRGRQQGFTSLREFKIENCVGLSNLPIEMLESCAPSLDALSLEGSSSLTNISEVIGCLPKMTRLTSLGINGVPKFISITYSGTYLEMGPSSESDSSWNNVSFKETFNAMLLQPLSITLRELTLTGMEQRLPDQLQHLNALEILNLRCFGIEELPEWFGKLSSLKCLSLQSLTELRHLPPKQEMQHLSKLTELYIDRCPLLLNDKKQNVDSERPKISHILSVTAGHLLSQLQLCNNNSERPQIVDSEWSKISHILYVTVDSRLYSHHGH